MAEKPPLPPKPKPPLPSKPRPKAAPAGARPTPPPPTGPGSRPAAAPPFKKPTLAPPPQVLPLKPPPAHQYRQQQQYPPGGGARKQPYRQQHPHHRHRRGGGCSCRRVCCLATGLALLALCLALAAACLAYLYYRPRAPSFHLQPLSPVRLRLGNNSSSAAVSAMDATVGARVVSWNPNERVAFRYGDGEGRVALRDADDGDVALGWAPVRGFAHAPRTVATVAFVATARGVVLDEAVAARVRDRYRRRQQGFRVVVDAHVGVRVGALRTGMVPVRLLCDDGAMAPRAADAGASDGGTVVGPMSKCQVLLFRVRWFSLN
ncbi:uncharacterized protein LOC8078361 [Sorghum bicolor]|uniref:Late embryogenesis abundant protein LEA-2 subgroup domain-containing protein n=2 Tax=Sorghum bicolor TaxID=4558 RepID=C5XZI1_SORBI|nr:uncharacterized protein LOC8078361 [Sorghum bicolor]EES04879.1 hypothetical protein SORBI_3004G116800 [Sorghum bicolor]|eukprot:XP_002451903.1 uncharacterized protein LOC8078361 [Sorghum bicolor]